MLASARPCHHPISRNDMMPTPSHPMNSRNMLLAIVRSSMAIRNISRYRKNLVMWGSEAMYQDANWRMDHVTNRAVGMNSTEYRSSLRLIGILKFIMGFHSQQEMMCSVPEWMNRVVGMRLIRKAVLVADVIVAVGLFKVFGSSWVNTGMRRVDSVRSREELSSVVSNTFTWTCTKMGGS